MTHKKPLALNRRCRGFLFSGMEIHQLQDKRTCGQAAAEAGLTVLRETLQHRGEAAIILATGASQFEVLDGLVAATDIPWHRVTAYHLDEYAGLPITHRASFRRYLWERFVRRLPLPLRHFHWIDAESDPAAESSRLSALIGAAPIDLAFVGIGENGHLAFNDPPADFDTPEAYRVVALDEACRRQQLGEGWFGSLDDVPRYAVSMSIPQILRSADIVCTAPETRKAAAVAAALKGPVTPAVPASALQRHPRCQMFLDVASAAGLSRR